jgi:signal transduction histidine kinase/CheY-like chemotaxis protein
MTGANEVGNAWNLWPDAMLAIGPDGRVTNMNASASVAGAPARGEIFAEALDADLFEIETAAGRRFEWRVAPANEDGVRLAAGRDVTDRVAAARAADDARTTMFARLTHELRTPLNGILGMAGLLGDASLTPPEREWLRAIRTSGEHLLGLVTDILDYARLGTGGVALEQVSFDPEALAQDIVELLSPRAWEKGLGISLVRDASAPGLVTGDDGRLRQIILNLAGNAIKFTPTGHVVVRLRGENDVLILEVDDTGPGVPADKRDMVFDEFAQVDGSHAREHGGAGLGLSVVRRIAEAMGGSVSVGDRPANLGGARFTVALPLPVTKADPLEVRRWRRTLSATRIGLVGGDDGLAEAISAALQPAGAKLKRFGPDETIDGSLSLVLVDARCRAGQPFRPDGTGNAPVVVLLPQEARDGIADWRAAGVEHWLIAPLRRRSLMDRLVAILAPEAVPQAEAGVAARPHDERADAKPARRLRLLVADDNPINLLLAKALLERSGHLVDTAADGAEALEALEGVAYDLAFLDIRMPRIDGLEAARRIRRMKGSGRATPLVALTADAGDKERALARAAGMDAFVTKPIDATRLKSVLDRLVFRAG